MQISRPVIQHRHENQFPKPFAETGEKKKKKKKRKKKNSVLF